MKLAMRLPEKGTAAANDADPREDASTEVIDLASRSSYPVVANRKGNSDALGLAAGIGFVMLLGGATLWGLNASRTSDDQATAAPAQQETYVPPAAAADPDADAGQVIIASPVAGDPEPQAILSADPSARAIEAGNPYSSPTLVFDAAGVATQVAGVAAAEAGNGAAPSDSVIPGAGAAGDFAARIGGVGGGPAVARADIAPATTVAQGTMIPAILETAINTDVPGYVRAVVSQDVKSFDGRNTLVPRSSRLIGQYQSGLQQGQKRAYVIWTRLIRPDGVSVALQSPATAFDGSGGLPGDVDSHFFQRFGSAMLLSVIGGLTTVASGGASVILGGGQSAANTALQQNGSISPTIRVRPGEPIRVVAARDLDFSQAPRVN